jgi:hypothetical protein
MSVGLRTPSSVQRLAASQRTGGKPVGFSLQFMEKISGKKNHRCVFYAFPKANANLFKSHAKKKGGNEKLSLDQYERIRIAHQVDGQGIGRIQRETGRDRKPIR